MHSVHSSFSFSIRRFLLLVLICGFSVHALAQPPTSLSYPTPNVFIANVTPVYMAPTVAGSVTTYSITPTLPAGLSLNTNTGVISGTPTAASAATSYTLTATNAAGSTTKAISILVTNNYFNNNNDTISFGGGTGATAVTITNIVGDGTSIGSIVLYKNVAQPSGQQIDCIVKTMALNNITTFNAYDQPAVSGTNFNSNSPKFFSPQFTFGTGGGSATFNFQFILGNTFDTSTKTGTNVTLQNVRLNTYDIDGNNAGSSNQYNEFGGFAISELSSSTTISAPFYNSATGLTKYVSSTSTNNTTVTADATRARVSYTNMSNFTIEMGAGATGLAFFFLDFSTGAPPFTTATATSAPTIDLDTSIVAVTHNASGCAAGLSFTATSQPNISSPTALTELSITYDPSAANLPDSLSEKLVVSGGTPTANDTISLDPAVGSSSSVTIGGVAYTITTTVSATSNKIAFTNGSTFTTAQAEVLLDALQFMNISSAPTAGKRVFTVKARNTSFESPAAEFTATLTCVSISGYIYHDANGLTDGAINANGTQLGVNGAYALLVNPSNNQVILSKGIAAGGAYSFGNATPGNYAIYVSSSAASIGSIFTAATFPGLYKSVGENLGSASGSDLLADGKLLLTVGSLSATNTNFGIEFPPVNTSTSYSSLSNPGGYNGYTLTSGAFSATDADGAVSSITITSFPAGANYLKVGSVIYTNGGTCPPQSTCTAWPGTVTIPYSSGNPTSSISVDPAADTNTSVVINYTSLDDGGISSITANSVTLNFTGIAGTNYRTINGSVWNDLNGDGIINASESLTAAAVAGQTLYAVLIQNNNTYSGAPTVYASTPVSSSLGYSFTDQVPVGSNYDVRIASLAAAPVAGSAASGIPSTLATNYMGVSTSNSGTITTGLNTTAPTNTISSFATAKSAVNFGIEQKPTNDAKSFTVNATAFSYTPPAGYPSIASYVSISANSSQLTGYATGGSLTGSDPEDCSTAGSCSTGRSFYISAINANTRVYYDNGGGAALMAVGSTLLNFDPSKLVIYAAKGAGTAGNSVGFSYTLVDAASMKSTPAAYSITSNSPLPVIINDFQARPADRSAIISWSTALEENIASFIIERSSDGKDFVAVGSLEPRGSNSTYRLSDPGLANGVYQYRLRATEYSGAFIYSSVAAVRINPAGNNSLVLSPNPATTSISIDGLQSDANVSFMDMSGKLLLTVNGVHSRQPLDVSILPGGMHIVRIVDANSTVTNLRMIRQ